MVPPDLPAAAVNPYLSLAVATLAVSFAAILVKASTAPPLVIAANRLLITTLILLPMLPGSRLAQLRMLPWRSWSLLTVSGLLLALHFGFWTASLSYTSVASSVLFVSVHPVLVAAVAWPLLGERVSPMAALGIALTIVGSALIAGGDVRLGGDALRGDLLAFLGAVVLGGYLLIGRSARQGLDNLTYSTPVYGICALTLTTLAILFRQSILAGSARDWLAFVGLAVICTLGGHLLYNWTLRYLPTAVVSASFLGDPVGSALLAWILLGQRVPPSTLAGGMIVLVGIWLTARR